MICKGSNSVGEYIPGEYVPPDILGGPLWQGILQIFFFSLVAYEIIAFFYKFWRIKFKNRELSVAHANWFKRNKKYFWRVLILLIIHESFYTTQVDFCVNPSYFFWEAWLQYFGIFWY